MEKYLKFQAEQSNFYYVDQKTKKNIHFRVTFDDKFPIAFHLLTNITEFYYV